MLPDRASLFICLLLFFLHFCLGNEGNVEEAGHAFEIGTHIKMF
jgi:hypothetical protein